MYSSEPLPHFVDDYLRYLQESRPTVAALDGVHVHDDLLEDLGRPAIEADLRALAGFARRLSEIDPAGLTEVEKAEQPCSPTTSRRGCSSSKRSGPGRETPSSTPTPWRPAWRRRRFSPSRRRPSGRAGCCRSCGRRRGSIQAARDNVKDPPGIFVKVGIETFNGALRFIEHDLPRAFRDVDDLHLLGDLADASTEAASAIRAYVGRSRDRAGAEGARHVPAGPRPVRAEAEAGRRPRASAADRLLAIAERELATTAGGSSGAPRRS